MSAKKFLFIYEHLSTGGIETLILRLANRLISESHDVTLIVREDGEIARLLDPNISVITLSQFKKLYNPKNARRIVECHNLFDIDVIFSFNPRSMLVAKGFSKIIKGAKFITGVYHPRAYFYDGYTAVSNWVFQSEFRRIDQSSIIFMNHDVRRAHQEYFSTSYDDSNVLNLPLDLPETTSSKTPTPGSSNLVISVGRFSPFKTYNLYMLDLIDDMNSDGYDIEYHIYGYGTLERAMREKISTLNFKDKIKLKGKLDYRQFGDVVGTALVFVGMGTAVLEAATYGAPAIVAIENEPKPVTYGFVHELDAFNCGEVIPNQETIPIRDLLISLLEISPTERKTIVDAGIRYTEQFGMDRFITKFMGIVDKASTHQENPARIFVFIDNLETYLISKYIQLKNLLS